MENAAPEITQKLLVNAGGWPAMKSAQELHKAGRVSDADYDPPLLSGMVREGNRNLRSGLRIKSASDVENLCTCRESREWGTICAHALAVGLAYIERTTAEARARETKAPAISDAPAIREPKFVELGAEDGIPLRLHFILPPNFESSWAKQQIMIVTEAEVNGKRTMPGTLSVDATYECDTFDLTAIDGLGQSAGAGERLAAMRMFSREEFLRFLHALRGHPRVSFGKSVAVEILQQTHRPKVLLERSGEDGITLRLAEAKNERLLVTETEAWSKAGNRFVACVEGLPFSRSGRWAANTARRARPSFSRAGCAASGELVRGPNGGGLVLPELRTGTPQFSLSIEGSMRELRARLYCRYGGGAKLPLGDGREPAPAFSRDLENENRILLRDLEAETAAVRRLESFGFVSASSGQFVARRENEIARFFAFEYPQIEIGMGSYAFRAGGKI